MCIFGSIAAILLVSIKCAVCTINLYNNLFPALSLLNNIIRAMVFGVASMQIVRTKSIFIFVCVADRLLYTHYRKTRKKKNNVQLHRFTSIRIACAQISLCRFEGAMALSHICEYNNFMCLLSSSLYYARMGSQYANRSSFFALANETHAFDNSTNKQQHHHHHQHQAITATSTTTNIHNSSYVNTDTHTRKQAQAQAANANRATIRHLDIHRIEDHTK